MIDIEAVRRSRRKYLTPEEAAGVLGLPKETRIRNMHRQLKDDHAVYGLPIVIKGKRHHHVLIPRREFLLWLKGRPAYPETR